MNDLERRQGERRQRGEKLDGLEERRREDRRSGPKSEMLKKQYEINLDTFAANLKSRKLEKFEVVFAEIVNRAKGKLITAWSKYEAGLAAADAEADPVRAKTIMEVAQNDLEDAVRRIKAEMEDELKLKQMK